MNLRSKWTRDQSRMWQAWHRLTPANHKVVRTYELLVWWGGIGCKAGWRVNEKGSRGGTILSGWAPTLRSAKARATLGLKTIIRLGWTYRVKVKKIDQIYVKCWKHMSKRVMIPSLSPVLNPAMETIFKPSPLWQRLRDMRGQSP